MRHRLGLSPSSASQSVTILINESTGCVFESDGALILVVMSLCYNGKRDSIQLGV